GGKPAAPPADGRPDGFVSLFNGTDLDGWSTSFSQPNSWRVENGVLIGSGPGYNRLIWERNHFRDFHLRVHARINDGGDGGVMFRWTTAGGYQAQIVNTTRRPSRGTGSLMSSEDKYLVEYRDPLLRPGEWFLLEVIAVGRHIVLKVNGKITADYTER